MTYLTTFKLNDTTKITIQQNLKRPKGDLQDSVQNVSISTNKICGI